MLVDVSTGIDATSIWPETTLQSRRTCFAMQLIAAAKIKHLGPLMHIAVLHSLGTIGVGHWLSQSHE
jgi:hypothetical protein